MGREVHVVVLILLSIFEVWMCYQVLYRTVLDKKYLRTWQKVLIWVNILGVGTVMGVNRDYLFFSRSMLLSCIIYTVLMAIILNVKKWNYIIEIVVVYFLFVALLDFFFLFCRMATGHNTYQFFYTGDYFFDKVLLYVLSRISILALLFFVGKDKKEEGILKKAQIFIIIAAGCLVIVVSGYHFLIYDILNGLSDISGWSAACSVVAIFVIVAFCIGICWKNQSLKQENQILEIREKLELNNLQNMEKVLEQNKIQVHDIRHHLIILKEYVIRKEYQAIEEYLNQLLESYAEVREERWTRIRILDILLSEKKRVAQEENIQFQIEVDVLKDVPFKETEISVLFGNLLDNAIEACRKINEEPKWIRVIVKQRKGLLFLQISNSIRTYAKKKDEGLVSDKKDKSIHGYGLKSVQRIVKKYDGLFQYNIENGEIEISISFFLNIN